MIPQYLELRRSKQKVNSSRVEVVLGRDLLVPRLCLGMHPVSSYKTYALKVDYSGQKGYAGLILSHMESDGNRLGGFAGWTASDALLLYGEGMIEICSCLCIKKN